MMHLMLSFDSNETLDSDGDGIGDNADEYPNDPQNGGNSSSGSSSSSGNSNTGNYGGGSGSSSSSSSSSSGNVNQGGGGNIDIEKEEQDWTEAIIFLVMLPIVGYVLYAFRSYL